YHRPDRAGRPAAGGVHAGAHPGPDGRRPAAAAVRVAYAVARYGEELRAGAELGTRMLAEHLVADRGWEVEVFTTCAREMTTWADGYEPGTVDVNGVTVHRFPSTSGRAPDFERFSDRVMTRPAATSMADAERWIELQGPVCP